MVESSETKKRQDENEGQSFSQYYERDYGLQDLDSEGELANGPPGLGKAANLEDTRPVQYMGSKELSYGTESHDFFSTSHFHGTEGSEEDESKRQRQQYETSQGHHSGGTFSSLSKGSPIYDLKINVNQKQFESDKMISNGGFEVEPKEDRTPSIYSSNSSISSNGNNRNMSHKSSNEGGSGQQQLESTGWSQFGPNEDTPTPRQIWQEDRDVEIANARHLANNTQQEPQDSHPHQLHHQHHQQLQQQNSNSRKTAQSEMLSYLENDVPSQYSLYQEQPLPRQQPQKTEGLRPPQEQLQQPYLYDTMYDNETVRLGSGFPQPQYRQQSSRGHPSLQQQQFDEVYSDPYQQPPQQERREFGGPLPSHKHQTLPLSMGGQRGDLGFQQQQLHPRLRQQQQMLSAADAVDTVFTRPHLYPHQSVYGDELSVVVGGAHQQQQQLRVGGGNDRMYEQYPRGDYGAVPRSSSLPQSTYAQRPLLQQMPHHQLTQESQYMSNNNTNLYRQQQQPQRQMQYQAPQGGRFTNPRMGGGVNHCGMSGPMGPIGGGVRSRPYGHHMVQGNYPNNNNSMNSTATDVAYLVQLKTLSRYHLADSFILPPGQYLQIGEFVMIEADKGEDMGIVTEVLGMPDFIAKQQRLKGGLLDYDDSSVGRIIRIASVHERQQLPAKFHDEQLVKETARHISFGYYGKNATIIEAEYQFDRNKLTIYYDSTMRIDFRELVRDLFASYKTRIWLKKYNVRHFYPKDFAVMALSTGVNMELM